jgi:hypothetical protein
MWASRASADSQSAMGVALLEGLSDVQS